LESSRQPALFGRGASRSAFYALIGAGLAQGAATGLLFIRAIAQDHLSLLSLRREVADDLATYAYIAVSTTIVFSGFGALIGRQADRLAALATTDPLTALSNARAYRVRIREEFARAARYRQPLSLLAIDVDRLKHVNDDYGHHSGDEMLNHVAAAIRNGLRQSDLGARIGGDEFAVVAPNTNQGSALTLAERLRALVVEGNGRTPAHGATVSIGISTFDPTRDASDEPWLMRSADAALYQAKREGGNRIACAGLQVT
jgi:diguanylate cyclase (GGDEF)-like protein